MTPFVTGYLAVGTANGNAFVELVDSTYARQNIVMVPTPGGGVINGVGANFVFANPQSNISQAAIFDSASGGNLLFWWNTHLRFQTGGQALAIYAGQLHLQIPSSAPGGTGVFAASTALGTAKNGNPVIAGIELTVQGGVLSEGDTASTIVQPGTTVAAPTGVYINGLPQAAAASDTDTVIVGQGGTIALAQPMSAIWTYIQGKIAGAGTSPPAQVMGLAAGTPTSSTVPLSWTSASGAATYVVQYQAGAGAWLTFETGITGTSATVTGLPASSPFNFRVYAVASAGAAGPVSSVVTATTAATSGSAPTTAPTVTVGTVTSTAVPLTWSAAVGANGYTVQYRVHGTSSWSTFATGVTSLADTITGLSASTEYDIQVAGTNGYGTGPYSSVVNATTSSASAVPGAVTGLSIGTVTATTMQFNWTAPTSGGTITNYTLQYRTPSGSGSYTVFSSTIAANATTATLTGMSVTLAYDVQVFATNSSGAGTAATLTNVTTAGYPGAVTGLTLGTATTTTLPITWTAPATGGSITGYTIQYRTPSGSGSWTTFSSSVSASATSATITGLTASTAYDVQVFATNATESGTPAVLTNVSTASGGSVPGAITGLTLGTATSSTLPLTWTLPTSGGAITAITVQYRTPSGSGSYTVASSSVSATATSYTITGLAASTAYDVQVFATNSSGSGTAGQLTNVSTASGTAPGAITNLANGTVTSSTVPLTWTAATTGSPTGTTVQYRLHGGSSWTTATSSLSGTATSYTVTGLSASTAYDFQVFATNSSGNGTAATLSNVSTGSATATWTIANVGSYTLPEAQTYSLSDPNVNDANAECAVYLTPSTPAPGAVWFGFVSSPSAVPAIGSTLNTSGLLQGATANGNWYAGPPWPRTIGTYYCFVAAVNSSGVVGGTLTGPAVTVTA